MGVLIYTLNKIPLYFSLLSGMGIEATDILLILDALPKAFRLVLGCDLTNKFVHAAGVFQLDLGPTPVEIM